MMKSNYKYADELKAAERKAKEEKLGVWSEEGNNSKIYDNSFNTENTETNDSSVNEKTSINWHWGYLIFVFIIIILGAYFTKIGNNDE